MNVVILKHLAASASLAALLLLALLFVIYLFIYSSPSSTPVFIQTSPPLNYDFTQMFNRIIHNEVMTFFYPKGQLRCDAH